MSAAKRKCQNSGHATMAVLILPTWWVISVNSRRSAAHGGTTNRAVPHLSSDLPQF
jgi:hypothetical protein